MAKRSRRLEAVREDARRPPVRSRVLLVRLTDAEHRAVRREATLAGVSMSALARSALKTVAAELEAERGD